MYCTCTGWVSSIHRGAAAARQVFLVHVVQPTGSQAPLLQEARPANVNGRGATCQGPTSGDHVFPLELCAAAPRRRHFADAAAADHNWSARRRRRRRPNVGVAPAPFSWSVHVTLYTSYVLLDFCNAVYNESSTLPKSSENDAGVFCNSPWYSNETQRRKSKSVFVDNFVKRKLMLKVSYRTSLQIRLIQRMVQWKISTACIVITAYKVAKSKRTDIAARRIFHNILNVW